MRTNKILIGLPTYNEAQNIELLVKKILLLKNFSADILILDDDSPDGTGAIADRLGTKHPNITVLHRKGKKGIGLAHSAIIAYAYANHYEILITMDTDFTHSPEDIPCFLRAADSSDIVIGTRFKHKEG